MEINKKSAIKTNEGNFAKFMILSKANVYRWKSNIMGFFTPILRPNPYIVLNIDASLAGWRASMAASKKGAFLIWRISAAHKYFRSQSCITRFSFYKQSIFDPRPKNCLSFSKKSSAKIV